jgi:hypothetical protein
VLARFGHEYALSLSFGVAYADVQEKTDNQTDYLVSRSRYLPYFVGGRPVGS